MRDTSPTRPPPAPPRLIAIRDGVRHSALNNVRLRQLADAGEETTRRGQEDLPRPSRLLPARAEEERGLPRARLRLRGLLHVHIPPAPARGPVPSLHGDYEMALRHSEEGHLDRLDNLEVFGCGSDETGMDGFRAGRG